MTSSHAVTRPVEADGGAARPDHIEFLGLPFSLVSQEDAVRLVIDRTGAPYRYVVTPNAYHVVMAHNDPARLVPIYQGAWLSLCDSRIVRALARLERYALPLVTGSDLVAALLPALNGHDRRRTPPKILVVGPPHTAEKALREA